jgi:hypothetical protein
MLGPEGDDTIADDLLVGAAPIATYLFGSPSKRRQVYQLASKLPLFRLGGKIAGRKSVLQRYMAQQEGLAEAAQ